MLALLIYYVLETFNNHVTLNFTFFRPLFSLCAVFNDRFRPHTYSYLTNLIYFPLINSDIKLVLQWIIKLDKKLTFFTYDIHLLQIFSVEVAGLHQCSVCNIPETKYIVKTKQKIIFTYRAVFRASSNI